MISIDGWDFLEPGLKVWKIFLFHLISINSWQKLKYYFWKEDKKMIEIAIIKIKLGTYNLYTSFFNKKNSEKSFERLILC